MQPAVGFDFGTTNCALAVVAPDGSPQLAHFSGPDGDVATFRSILYFDRDDPRAPVDIHAGPGALLHYLEREEHDGRLVQSLKSFLTSRLFSATRIFDENYRLEDLIALLARKLREGAERAAEIATATLSGSTSTNPTDTARKCFSTPLRYHIWPVRSAENSGACPGSTPRSPPEAPGTYASNTVMANQAPLGRDDT